MPRDNFSLNTKRKLAERAGFQCSFPGCGIMTIGASSTSTESSVSIGEAAHISAASPGGPRYDKSLPFHRRSSIDNGIWLCRTHAALIDRDVNKYTIKLLTAWKYEAEKRSQENIGKQSVQSDKDKRGIALTAYGSNKLYCKVENVDSGEIQDELSELNNQSLNSIKIVLSREEKENFLDFGSDRMWDQLGIYFRSNLSLATFNSKNIEEITIGQLISEVYHRFLSGIVPPHSYGKDWVLCSLGWGGTEIIAPWSLLSSQPKLFKDSNYDFKTSYKSFRKEYKQWAIKTLKDVNVTLRKYWVIRDPKNISIFGIASGFYERIDFIRNTHPEALKMLSRTTQVISRPIVSSFYGDGSLFEVPKDLVGKNMIIQNPKTISSNSYSFKVLFENPWYSHRNIGRVFIVSDEV